MRNLGLLAMFVASLWACDGTGTPDNRSGGFLPEEVEPHCRAWCEPETGCSDAEMTPVQCLDNCLADAERDPCFSHVVTYQECMLAMECADPFEDCEQPEGLPRIAPGEASCELFENAYARCSCENLYSGGAGGSGGDNPAVVDAQWNLSCPSSGVGCGSWAQETCIGTGGQREIVGEHGQAVCNGEQIIARCVAVDKSDGTRTVTLEANIGDKFAFELRGASIDAGGAVQLTSCNVTIIEDEVPYDVGACGQEPPSVEQPCQLSNVSVEGSEVIFGLECDSLLSSVTGYGLDVGALGGGPTTIRFANCSGF